MQSPTSRSREASHRGTRLALVVLIAASLLTAPTAAEAALGDGPIDGYKSTAYRFGGKSSYVRARVRGTADLHLCGFLLQYECDKITNPRLDAWVYVPYSSRSTYQNLNRVPEQAKVEGSFWFDGAALAVSISGSGPSGSFRAVGSSCVSSAFYSRRDASFSQRVDWSYAGELCKAKTRAGIWGARGKAVASIRFGPSSWRSSIAADAA